MKNVWIFTKLQLLQAFSINEAIKSGKRGKLIGYAFLFVYIAGAGGFMIYSMADSIVASFAAIGALESYPALIAGLVSVTTIIYSIFRAPGSLFSARELEHGLSLPVKSSELAMARLAGLYITNLPFALLTLIPSAIPYIRAAAPEPIFYLYFTVSALFIPVIPLIIASIIGTVIAFVASKIKFAKVFNLVFLSAATLGAMYFSFSVNMGASEDLLAMQATLASAGSAISGFVNSFYPLAAIYTGAIYDLSLVSFLGFTAINLAALWLFSLALGACFVRVSTSINARRARFDYKVGALKENSAASSLITRELKHLFSVPMWVFNSLFGLLLMLIAAGALALKSEELFKMVPPELNLPIGKLLPLAFGWLAAMSCVTGCSISLEGRTLWQIKTLPVSGRAVMNAKLCANLLLVLPVCLVSALAVIPTMGMGAADAALLIVFPMLASVFTIICGLIGNLKWHRFDWTNEIAIVKQSWGAMFPILLSMVIMFPLIFLSMTPGSPEALIPISALALAVADAVLALVLGKNAERWYQAL